MLDCWMEGKKRVCNYNDTEYSVSQLHKLDECVVSLPTLTQRISQGCNNYERSGWDSIKKCLTVVAIRGCPKGDQHVKKLNRYNLFEESEFLKVMQMMPTNRYKPRIIQSR